MEPKATTKRRDSKRKGAGQEELRINCFCKHARVSGSGWGGGGGGGGGAGSGRTESASSGVSARGRCPRNHEAADRTGTGGLLKLAFLHSSYHQRSLRKKSAEVREGHRPRQGSS